MPACHLLPKYVPLSTYVSLPTYAIRLAVVAAVTLGVAIAVAAEPDASADFWEINTRYAPRCHPADPATEAIRFRRCEDGCWRPATRTTFFDSLGDRPLIVFVHGNLSEPGDAIQAAMRVRSILRRHADGRPFRLALWSWPAGRVTRPIARDARIKARYSDTQAYYLAALLRDVETDAPVALIGYSFGARAVCGALHMLAGGTVAGMGLSESDDSPPPMRVVLAAAAMNCYWLGPGQRLGRALSMSEQTAIIVNRADPVLKRYPRLYGRRRCGPEALGYVGPGGLSSDTVDRVRLIPVQCSVGRNHQWAQYLRSGGLHRAIADAAFEPLGE